MEANEMVDGLVRDALTALDRFSALDQEQVDRIVGRASLAALAAHGDLARLAVEETGRGLFEDKAVKNLFACEHVVHSMRGLKTAGVIRRDEQNGITEIAEPVGVVCAMTPVATPTSTTVFKALLAPKTRNPVVFAFHPSAQRCSAEAARIVRDAAVAAGAPVHRLLLREARPGRRRGQRAGVRPQERQARPCGPRHRALQGLRPRHDLRLRAGRRPRRGDLRRRPRRVERLGAHLVTAAEKTKLEEFLFGTTAYAADCAAAELNPAPDRTPPPHHRSPPGPPPGRAPPCREVRTGDGLQGRTVPTGSRRARICNGSNGQSCPLQGR